MEPFDIQSSNLHFWGENENFFLKWEISRSKFIFDFFFFFLFGLFFFFFFFLVCIFFFFFSLFFFFEIFIFFFFFFLNGLFYFFFEVGDWIFLSPCYHARHLQQTHWFKIFSRMYGLVVMLTIPRSKVHLCIPIVV